MNSETRNCQNCKQKFVIEPEDFVFYERLQIPPADECPTCRFQHLFAFWSFGRFHKTASALSGKSIITTFPEMARFPIYEREEWVSDAWDPMSFGKNYDFDRKFFPQFEDLQSKVPHPHQVGVNNVRCQWSDDVWNSKDCYLSRSLLDCEQLSYCYRLLRCKNSVDLVYCFDSQFSYDCVYCFKCYKVRHAFDARDSMESAFLFDCRNVSNCFMCWNLRNKQYHILNQPYTKDEYEKKLREYDLRSRRSVQKLKQQFKEIIAREAIHRENFNTKVVNSTGNFVTECKNCFSCYFIEYSENCRYVARGFDASDTIDSVGGITEKSAVTVLDEWSYETLGTSHSVRCRYSAYLDYCEECEYCFGCVGLRKKKFCVLNKQYTEEAYHILVEKIKEAMRKSGEWGRFFPMRMAYCGYNFSLANIHFPETKERILQRGGLWEDVVEVAHEGINGDELPDRIDDVPADIATKAIIDRKAKRRFSFATHELEFYKTLGIPLPAEHPDVRVLELFRPIAEAIYPQHDRCVFCQKEIRHYYSSGFGYQKIACIECYQREVA